MSPVLYFINFILSYLLTTFTSQISTRCFRTAFQQKVNNIDTTILDSYQERSSTEEVLPVWVCSPFEKLGSFLTLMNFYPIYNLINCILTSFIIWTFCHSIIFLKVKKYCTHIVIALFDSPVEHGLSVLVKLVNVISPINLQPIKIRVTVYILHNGNFELLYLQEILWYFPSLKECIPYFTQFTIFN